MAEQRYQAVLAVISDGHGCGGPRFGAAAAGRPIDVWVTDQVLQFYDGQALLRTQKRTSAGEVRVKRSQAPQRRSTVQPSVTDQPN